MPVQRRLPAAEKSIAEITDKDIRVRILGTVIGTGDSSLMIDDATGRVEVTFDDSIDYIKQGQLIRIIARILPQNSGFECKGVCIQTLEGFDIELYKRAKEVVRSS